MLLRSSLASAALAAWPAVTKRRLLALAGLVVAGLLQAPAALAESRHGDHAHVDSAERAHGAAHHQDRHADHGGLVDDEHADNPIVQAYREANDRMHSGMTTGFTGDPDVDFARGMIPHHRGAIEMAEVLLEHGEDEQLRALAREIIEAQEGEIAFLEQWLEANGH